MQEGGTSANRESNLTKASRVRHWLEIRGPRTDAARALSASAAGVKTSSLGRMRASTFRPGRVCRVFLAAGSNVGKPTLRRGDAPRAPILGGGRKKRNAACPRKPSLARRLFARGFTATVRFDAAPRERPEPDQWRQAD